MTASLTPSPWRIGDAGRTIFGAPNGNPSPKTIAHVVSTRADARLLAAAPELLKALQDLVKALPASSSKTPRERWNAGARARAAIAKAEGRDQ